MKNRASGLVLLCLMSLPALAQQPAPACNRACLEGYVDRYLDAMEANDVSPKLFGRDVKFTEDGVRPIPFIGK